MGPPTTTTTTEPLDPLIAENYLPCTTRYTSPIVDNQKCRYAHEDRLWRLDGLSLELCRLKCLGREDCNAFSFAESGDYAKLCMGCRGAAGSAEHEGFKYY